MAKTCLLVSKPPTPVSLVVVEVSQTSDEMYITAQITPQTVDMHRQWDALQIPRWRDCGELSPIMKGNMRSRSQRGLWRGTVHFLFMSRARVSFLSFHRRLVSSPLFKLVNFATIGYLPSYSTFDKIQYVVNVQVLISELPRGFIFFRDMSVRLSSLGWCDTERGFPHTGASPAESHQQSYRVQGIMREFRRGKGDGLWYCTLEWKINILKKESATGSLAFYFWGSDRRVDSMLLWFINFLIHLYCRRTVSMRESRSIWL